MPESRSRLPLIGRTAIIVSIVAAGALFWSAQVRYDVIAKRFAEVVPGEIYRAGKLTPASMKRVVERHHIKTIVDLGAWEPGTPDALLAQHVADELGVTRVVYDLEGDATGDPNAYVQTLRVMTDPQRQPVLIHCGAGTERTGCAVILYRHIVQDVPLDDALREARRAGHDPERNPRLEQVLDQWLDPITAAYHNDASIPWTADAPPAERATSDQ